jgi:hypothetical protein
MRDASQRLAPTHLTGNQNRPEADPTFFPPLASITPGALITLRLTATVPSPDAQVAIAPS